MLERYDPRRTRPPPIGGPPAPLMGPGGYGPPPGYGPDPYGAHTCAPVCVGRVVCLSVIMFYSACACVCLVELRPVSLCGSARREWRIWLVRLCPKSLW